MHFHLRCASHTGGSAALAGKDIRLNTDEFLELYRRIRVLQTEPPISMNSDTTALQGLAQLAAPQESQEILKWLSERG